MGRNAAPADKIVQVRPATLGDASDGALLLDTLGYPVPATRLPSASSASSATPAIICCWRKSTAPPPA